LQLPDEMPAIFQTLPYRVRNLFGFRSGFLIAIFSKIATTKLKQINNQLGRMILRYYDQRSCIRISSRSKEGGIEPTLNAG
jgi:hypothetical protein